MPRRSATGPPTASRADEPRFRFVSPLADGADQIAAEVALELGFSLHAVLPFERDDYRRDFADDGAAASGSTP